MIQVLIAIGIAFFAFLILAIALFISTNNKNSK